MPLIDNILSLSALHEFETSPLTREKLTLMLNQAFFVTHAGDGEDGYMICFDQDASYESVNFQWFQSQFARFIYVDRIVVASHARGKGLAKGFYSQLFKAAKADGHDRITCEINLMPPNPVSLALHRSLGFSGLAQRQLDTSKQVSYQQMML
jgi:uncharacterized protein